MSASKIQSKLHEPCMIALNSSLRCKCTKPFMFFKMFPRVGTKRSDELQSLFSLSLSPFTLTFSADVSLSRGRTLFSLQHNPTWTIEGQKNKTRPVELLVYRFHLEENYSLAILFRATCVSVSDIFSFSDGLFFPLELEFSSMMTVCGVAPLHLIDPNVNFLCRLVLTLLSMQQVLGVVLLGLCYSFSDSMYNFKLSSYFVFRTHLSQTESRLVVCCVKSPRTRELALLSLLCSMTHAHTYKNRRHPLSEQKRTFIVLLIKALKPRVESSHDSATSILGKECKKESESFVSFAFGRFLVSASLFVG